MCMDGAHAKENQFLVFSIRDVDALQAAKPMVLAMSA